MFNEFPISEPILDGSVTWRNNLHAFSLWSIILEDIFFVIISVMKTSFSLLGTGGSEDFSLL